MKRRPKQMPAYTQAELNDIVKFFDKYPDKKTRLPFVKKLGRSYQGVYAKYRETKNSNLKRELLGNLKTPATTNNTIEIHFKSGVVVKVNGDKVKVDDHVIEC